MGNLTDSAPPYEDLYNHNHNHSPNKRFGLGSSSAYSAVPQIEEDGVPDLEPGVQATSSPRSGTPLQMLSKPDQSNGHVHCDGCDRLLELKEKRRHDLKCCGLVAATFAAAFICAVLIVVAVVR